MRKNEKSFERIMRGEQALLDKEDSNSFEQCPPGETYDLEEKQEAK